MEFRSLGKSGLQVSAISFGAGPISGLMVAKNGGAQRRTVRRAIDANINWFDTAATYGEGQSERTLGAALHSCRPSSDLHVATKVRLTPDQFGDIGNAVRESFDASLKRLQIERVTLLQLHNSVTSQRGDLPTSVTVEDVLGPAGIVEAFESLKVERRVEHFGFTGLGAGRVRAGIPSPSASRYRWNASIS